MSSSKPLFGDIRPIVPAIVMVGIVIVVRWSEGSWESLLLGFFASVMTWWSERLATEVDSCEEREDVPAVAEQPRLPVSEGLGSHQPGLSQRHPSIFLNVFEVFFLPIPASACPQSFRVNLPLSLQVTQNLSLSLKAKHFPSLEFRKNRGRNGHTRTNPKIFAVRPPTSLVRRRAY